MGILDKIVGNSYKKVIGKLQRVVDRINHLEEEMKKLKDADFPLETEKLKKELAEAEGNLEVEYQIIEEITPRALALVREAARRVWGERHFDVQLIGGLVLNQGKIAEMKTGEGKTLVATLPLYLNALSGRGAHLVTVNDYLSKHQGEGMGEIYHFLGLSTGIIQSNQSSYKFEKNKDYKHYSECDGSNLLPCSRLEAYACDITYGTNNEFGFDYLRDNMAPNLESCVMRQLNFAIVDEVDSILIDEARTPLIISAAAEESASLYQQFATLVPRLEIETDYIVDEKDRAVSLTDSGIAKMEQMLGIKNIYETDSITLVHHLEEALKAHALFKRDKDYVVKDGEVIIVDEFTGRLMVGRRFNEGLHQAIEAKEGVEVKRESQTMATISFQNLFRIYKKLAGMTGTAATEAEEFFKIYKLDVVEIPTNKPMVRRDFNDLIYKTEAAKWQAIIADIKTANAKGQPVLVGTVSVEKNEQLSKMLKKSGVKHEILNAKHHDREAKIIVKAGLKGGVTVATNMAGRGTDIKLGEGVRELGGLHVIGTERHEARRIDNQLRGRSGRQGDDGSSQFYVSLEDDLMRIFGGEKIKNLMDRLGLPDDMPIENKMISKSIESAQRRVEGYNFDTRKHLVEYDDVMNKHREIIYKKRRAILESGNPKSEISFESEPEGSSLRVEDLNLKQIPSSAEATAGRQNSNNEIQDIDNWEDEEEEKPQTIKEDILGILDDELERICNLYIEDKESLQREVKVILGEVVINGSDPKPLQEIAHKLYEEKEAKYGAEVMRNIEKMVYLRTIDMLWVEHLTTIEELRTAIGLRGYGQRDPLVEYKHEAFTLFQQLMAMVEANIAKTILKIEVQVAPTAPIRRPLEYHAPDADRVGDSELSQNSNVKTSSFAKATEDRQNHSSKLKSSDVIASEAKQPNNEAMKQSNNNSGVTTTIRTPGGKTVFERMAASAGKQGTVTTSKKVGRNDPCPCGSGKKYKKCCGR